MLYNIYIIKVETNLVVRRPEASRKDQVMTNREFYTAITTNTITEEVIAKAMEELNKLDVTNAKRREKSAEKANANQAFVEKLVTFLGEAPQTASELLMKFAAIADEMPRVDGKPYTVQYVSNLARAAVEQGLCKVGDVKIKGKGTQKGYSL